MYASALLLAPLVRATPDAAPRAVICTCPGALFVDDATGTDDNGSGCAETPLKTVSAAVQCAAPTATISVSAGTYVGGNMTVSSGSILTIQSAVPGNGEVILDGNLQRTFDVEAGAWVAFSNITFTNGHAIAAPVDPDRQQFCDIPLQASCPGRFGGAIRVTDAQLACDACVFKANVAMCGGAISVSRSNATFKGCLFESNGGPPPMSFPFALEPTTGGALYAEDSAIAIDQTSFIDNKITGFRGAAGGALYLARSILSITDNNFTRNVVEATALCRGGALYLNHTATSITRTGFVGNGIVTGPTGNFATGGAVYAAAKGYGDGRWPPAGGVAVDDDLVDGSDPDVEDGMYFSLDSCFFQNNFIESGPSSYAAAMLLWNFNVTMHNVQVVDHAVPKALGTVIMLACAAQVGHSSFKNNSVAHGGAFYINQHSRVHFSDCNFEDCSGELGGALFIGYGKFHEHRIHGVSAINPTAMIEPRADLLRCNFQSNTDGAQAGQMMNSFGGAVYVDGKLDSVGDPVTFAIGIRNSEFDGCKSSSGGALALVGAVDLDVSGSWFGASNVAQLGADQVYAQGSHVSARIATTKMEFSGIANHRAVSVFSGANISYSAETTFRCPNGSLVLQAGSDYMCKPCLAPQYNLWEGLYKNGEADPNHPNGCFDCPFRADCSVFSEPSALNPSLVVVKTRVNATRDAYGVVSRGQATFHSCPDGYCCQADSCALASCGGNRDPSTLLCGGCLPGFSLSIDTPNCIDSGLCGNEAEYWVLQIVQWLFWGSLWTYQAWRVIIKHGEAMKRQAEQAATNTKAAARNLSQVLKDFISAERETHYSDKDPGSYNRQVFMQQCITILVAYGQLARVVIPDNNYASFFGELFSAEVGWLITAFAPTQSGDTKGWCINEGLEAADKYWMEYAAAFALIASGSLIAYLWSKILSRPCLAFYARCQKQKKRVCGEKKDSHSEPLLFDEGRDVEHASQNDHSTTTARAGCLSLLNERQTGSSNARLFHSANARIENSNFSVEEQASAKPKQGETTITPTTRQLILAVLWSGLMFVYTRLSRATIALLSCVTISQEGGGATVFFHDGTQGCNIGGWQLPAMLMLVLLFGLPLTPLFLSACHFIRYGSMYEESTADPALRFVFGLAKVLNPFRSPCWFWRFLMPLHTLMLVMCASGFLIPGITPLTSAIFVLLYCMTMLLLTASFRPYSFRVTNFLEIFCNIFLLLLAAMNLPNSAWASLGRFPEVTTNSKDLFDQWQAMNSIINALFFVPLGTFVLLLVPVSLRTSLDVTEME